MTEERMDTILSRIMYALAGAAVAVLLVLLTLIALAPPAEAARLRWTYSTTQAETLGCGAGTRPLGRIDSVRVVGWERVRGWRWWPVGWYVPARRILLARVVPPGSQGRADSADIALPIGPDSTFTVELELRNGVGWSCTSNGATITCEK